MLTAMEGSREGNAKVVSVGVGGVPVRLASCNRLFLPLVMPN